MKNRACGPLRTKECVISMHKIMKNFRAAMILSAAIIWGSVAAQAASTLDFTAAGTLGPVLSGSDPLGLNTKGFSFTGFIDESATPTTCPTGLPVTPNVCYTVPPSQLTGQIGALPPVTIPTASTLGVIAPATGNDALVIQLTVFGNAVTAVLELAPGSFASGIMQHPGPFKPSPQT